MLIPPPACHVKVVSVTLSLPRLRLILVCADKEMKERRVLLVIPRAQANTKQVRERLDLEIAYDLGDGFLVVADISDRAPAIVHVHRNLAEPALVEDAPTSSLSPICRPM